MPTKTPSVTSAKGKATKTKAKTNDTVATVSSEPNDERWERLTAQEEARVEANQRRYDLRTSGKSSAEVNEIMENDEG